MEVPSSTLGKAWRSDQRSSRSYPAALRRVGLWRAAFHVSFVLRCLALLGPYLSRLFAAGIPVAAVPVLPVWCLTIAPLAWVLETLGFAVTGCQMRPADATKYGLHGPSMNRSRSRWRPHRWLFCLRCVRQEDRPWVL
ncbi:hypothetical protein B0T16DRAFT_407647, partial [Cercophora newfieldiana]